MSIGSRLKDTHWLVWFWILAYVVCAFIWHFLADAPWDDDCVTRYFNTRNALTDPYQFLKVWNRPLFVLLFVIPFQFGQHAVLFMVLLSAFSSYLLYRIAKDHLKLHSSFIVVPFLLFQVFYFGVSRNALTEPLAAFLITAGLYAYYEKKYWVMALAGGLLPLARMELTPLLLVWIVPLIREKQWKALILMAVPVFMWNLAGAIADGELLWIVEKTVGKDKGTNRYGQKPFNHYFLRVIYVLGPTVFFFSLIGMLERFFRKKFDAMITVQLIVGFMIYVLFSWKLSLGNAAGFLRHLISLSPLFALLAARGFNYWWNGLSLKEWPVGGEDRDTAKDQDELAQLDLAFEEQKLRIKQEGREKNWKHKKVSALLKKAHAEYDTELLQLKESKKQASKQTGRTIGRTWRIILLPILLLVISFFFFSKELQYHQKVSEIDDFSNFWVILGLFIAGLLLAFFSNIKRPSTVVASAIAVGIGSFTAAYTLYTEPPDAHNSTERRTIAEFAELYKNSSLVNYPLYVNHNYFFWAAESSPFDLPHGSMKQEELLSAPDSSIIIWESHYSHRLRGDVHTSWFKGKKEFVELFAMRSENNSFLMNIYMKLSEGGPADKLSMFDRMEEEFPGLSTVNSSRGKFYMNNMNDLDASLNEYNIAISKDSNSVDALLGRGFVFTKQRKYQESIDDYTSLVGVNPKLKEAYLNRGTAYTNLGQHESAIEDYARVIEIDDKQYLAYVNRSISHNAMGNYALAEQDLTKAAKIQPRNADVYLKRATIYQRLNELDRSIDDLSRAIKLQPKNGKAYLTRGATLIQKGDTKNGCIDLQKAIELGDPKAPAYFQRSCQ